jgi:hypothetical protein
MPTFTSSASALKLAVSVKRGRPSEKARNGRWVSASHDDAYFAIDAIGPTGERFNLRSHRAWCDVRRATFEEYMRETMSEVHTSCAECGIDATPTAESLKAFEALARTCHAEARTGEED